MDWKKQFERWMGFEDLRSDLREELKHNENNETYLEDSFYKNLEFGTGGMRGEIGPGTNRMNIYTIRKAAQGLADYMKAAGEDAMSRGVVIAHDNRRQSDAFALEAACTLGANGIKAYVISELRPTPQLSFAVRELNTHTGIMITASHNPPEYNGFKVYGEDGGQLVPADADRLIEMVNAVEDELLIKTAEKETLEQEGLLEFVLEDMDRKYGDKLETVVVDSDLVQSMGEDLSIVFTPLHGAAQQPMMDGFARCGFSNVHVVEEQAVPDTEFSAVTSPNPEEHRAFDRAMVLGDKRGADVLIATDPDGDRVGVAAKDKNGQYKVLTGNQTGALMLDYLLSKRKEAGTLPDNGVVIKTIVTSEMGRRVAGEYGVDTLDVLTGFKFISEKIRNFESSGENTYLFGYEESYGYLIEPFARDKDAIQAALLASEVAAYYKKQGKTLHDGLLDLFEKYGCYLEDLESFVFKGKAGAETMNAMMDSFRESPVKELSGQKVKYQEDYLTGLRTYVQDGEEKEIGLPLSNVIKVVLEDGSWYCLRPSGTEPKIKAYFGVNRPEITEAEQALESLKADVLEKVNTATS
ncbi:phospho-sugar mutase [Alteribacter natronophilus]|uniref:phospho-sugar mutase n=1 Tax=Alteribacter natronophilus TaxID=2583810 RepID=UPI00110E4680|nr:phospho-sugar mutase [Alteribacter natronophilus]TMW70403.1 phospho-sugar mutase [Alteribacter natronophilus]